MRWKLFTLVVGAGLWLPAAAVASDAGCCGQHKADHAMACCKADQPANPAAAKSMDREAAVPEAASTQVRQSTVVWFHRPVWVGRRVLMGQYLIEHDMDRQARGEPCTHIYAMDDRQTPVVALHCRHVEGEPGDRAVVVLQTMGDGTRKLVLFQFAGEDGAHGVSAR